MAWESAFWESQLPSTRKAFFRISFTLGNDGGPLHMLAKITRCFLGGTISHGRQYISWIHIDDLNQMFLEGLRRDDIQGLYNATSPVAVPNAIFMKALRKALHRPWCPPAPAFAIKLGTWIMGTEAELPLLGRRGVPKRLLEQGFEFKHVDLDESLRSLYA